jgi:hypothetical protein
MKSLRRNKSSAVHYTIGLLAMLSAAPVNAVDGDWEFAIAPYIWGPGIDGTIGISGTDAPVDAPFSDLLEFVDVAGSLGFEAAKGRWGAFGDIWFADLSLDDDGGPVGNVRTDMDLVIGEVGGVYRLGKPVELYFGLRYQDIDSTIRFEQLLDPVSIDESINDFIVGARYLPTFGRRDRWGVILRGDIGRGDSDLIWLAQVGGTYQVGKHWHIALAYRYMKTDFEDSDFKYDVALQGLGIGAAYCW